jgi:hypothetical protein
VSDLMSAVYKMTSPKLSPESARRKRAMNAGNAAITNRRKAMTRENALIQQIYLAALFNSMKRPKKNKHK